MNQESITKTLTHEKDDDSSYQSDFKFFEEVSEFKVYPTRFVQCILFVLSTSCYFIIINTYSPMQLQMH
jgi:hypothetical protein